MSVKLITLTRPVPMSVRELSGGWLCQGGEREEGYHPGCTERSRGSLGRPGADLDRTGRQAPTSLFRREQKTPARRGRGLHSELGAFRISPELERRGCRRPSGIVG